MNQVMMSFEPLQETEFHDYWQYAVDSWMRDMIEAGFIDSNISKEDAEAEVNRFLPQGMKTPGHYFFNVVENDENVGKVWIGVRTRSGTLEAFLWDIVIDEKHRGKGYGKGAMILVEDFARKKGAKKISLNVFAYNDVARNLYRKTGYRESAITMIKTL